MNSFEEYRDLEKVELLFAGFDVLKSQIELEIGQDFEASFTFRGDFRGGDLEALKYACRIIHIMKPASR